jgi:hypothetical protein
MRRELDTAGRLLTGVILVLLGGLFLVNNLGVIEIGPIGRYWPFILIVMGLGRMAQPGHRRGGAWLLFLGGLFLLHSFDYLRIHDSWPLFIVAAGVGILWRSVSPRLPCGCVGTCTCARKEA